MATKEQLENALRNAHNAGDTDAARKLANALKSMQEPSPTASVSPPQALTPQETPEPTGINEALLNAPGGREVLEAVSGINRGIAETIDFFGSDMVNAAFELSGSDFRVPTVSEQEIVKEAATGQFMPEGLARDIIGFTGEFVGGAATGGAGAALTRRVLPPAVKLQEGLRRGYAKIIEPHSTIAVERLQVPHRTVNSLRIIENQLTRRQADTIRLIQDIPTIKPSNLNQQNFNAVAKEINRRAGQLSQQLSKVKPGSSFTGARLTGQSLKERLTKNMKNTFENDAIFEQKDLNLIKKVRDRAMKIVGKHEKSASGLLDARKELDKIYQSKAFDRFGDFKDTPQAAAFKTARDFLNDEVERLARGSNFNVRQSLHEQKLLFDLRDILLEKAAREAKTPIKRTIQRLEKKPIVGGLFERAARGR